MLKTLKKLAEFWAVVCCQYWPEAKHNSSTVSGEKFT